MKSIVSKIAKEIIAEQEQVRLLREAIEKDLQERLNQACKNDVSHTKRLSQ